MKKLLVMIGISAIVLGETLVYTTTAHAYRGDPSATGPYYSQERHESMEQAFENNDYDAWKTLMQGRGRVSQVINKDNFTKFAEAHELAEEGKFDQAAKIRQELGLGLTNGSTQQMGRWTK